MKIIDLLEQQNDNPFISYEFFPPKTEKGVQSLHKKLEILKPTNPLFLDYTWGAGGSTAELTLELSIDAKQRGFEPNMHLTCTNMDARLIDTALEQCKAAGIQNIVALRGDPPAGTEEWTVTDGGFTCALDLVKHIRKEYGDYFGISVAGYPEGHPNTIHEITAEEAKTLTPAEQLRLVNLDGKLMVCRDADYAKEIVYLKEKVDAGADFIITQMFFDVECFLAFVKSCRQAGIECPIVPGIMCVQNYNGFHRMIQFCKTRVPESIKKDLEAIKHETELIKKFGVKLGTQLCKTLWTSQMIPGLHFYTLNQDQLVREIREELQTMMLLA